MTHSYKILSLEQMFSWNKWEWACELQTGCTDNIKKKDYHVVGFDLFMGFADRDENIEYGTSLSRITLV